MNDCPDCAPRLHGFSYIAPDAISVVFQCGCGPAQFTFMHDGPYQCPCGEPVTVDRSTELRGRIIAGKPILQFTCSACGDDFEDARFTAR